MLTLLKESHTNDIPFNYFFSISIQNGYLTVDDSGSINITSNEQIYYKNSFNKIYSNGKLIFNDLILLTKFNDMIMIKDNKYYCLDNTNGVFKLNFNSTSKINEDLRIVINKYEKYNNPNIILSSLPFVWYNKYLINIGDLAFNKNKFTYDILTKKLDLMNTDDSYILINNKYLYNSTLECVLLNVDNEIKSYPPSYIATDLSNNSIISFKYDESDKNVYKEFYIHCFNNPNLFMGYNSYYINFLPNRNNTTWIFIKVGENYGYIMELKSEKVLTYNNGYVLNTLEPNEFGLENQIYMIKHSKIYQYNYINKNLIELGYKKINNNEFDLTDTNNDYFLFRYI
jgi:hypothetical protein